MIAEKLYDKLFGNQLLQLKSELGHEDEFNREVNFETNAGEFYDVVDLSSAAFERNVAVDDAFMNNAYQKPPLRDFILKIKDSDGAVVNFRIHCYGKKSQRILANDQHSYAPRLDIAQLDDSNKVVAIMQVLTQKKCFDRYITRPVAVRRNAIESDNYLEQFYVMADYVLWHYIQMVKCFHDRPESFVDTRVNGHKQLTMQMQEPEPLREVKIQTVRQNPEVQDAKSVEATEDGAAGRKMTCPYWTVSGHYRTYKSGKRIWIEPYAKGAKRNDPEQNNPKTYVPSLQKGE